MSFLSLLCKNSRAKLDSGSVATHESTWEFVLKENPNFIVGILPILISEIDPAVQNWVVTSGDGSTTCCSDRDHTTSGGLRR